MSEKISRYKVLTHVLNAVKTEPTKKIILLKDTGILVFLGYAEMK